LNVSVIDQQSVPLEGIVGKDVGQVFKTLAEKNGINIIVSAQIKNIKS
jgi:hypothetical protein